MAGNTSAKKWKLLKGLMKAKALEKNKVRRMGPSVGWDLHLEFFSVNCIDIRVGKLKTKKWQGMQAPVTLRSGKCPMKTTALEKNEVRRDMPPMSLIPLNGIFRWMGPPFEIISVMCSDIEM